MLRHEHEHAERLLAKYRRECFFGLTEIALPIIASGLTSMGVSAATAGTIASIAAPALVGSGVGALGSAITGGDPGKGALWGGLSGGALGGFGAAFPETAASLGIPAYDSGGFPINPGSAGGSGFASMGADGNWIPGAGGFPATGGGSGPLSATLGPGGTWTPGPGGFPDANSGGGGGLAGSSASAIRGISPGSLALGALSALTSGARKPDYSMAPGPATTAATRGPLFDATFPNASAYINRTPTPNYQPPGGDWYKYGESGGSMPFWSGNQLNFNNNGVPMARGGALGQSLSRTKGDGDHGYVQGAGDGMDDAIHAKLSDGEFVVNADVVSAIGNGSNRKGAERLEHMRRAVMRDRGTPRVVPKKIKKSPLQYLAKASR